MIRRTSIDQTGHNWGDFAGQVALGALAVVGGVTLLTLSGGTATVLASGLIGAGVGGLAYDITAAASHQGANVSWGDRGIEVGIGAATGLITGGFSVGATCAFATTASTVERVALTSAVMAVAGSGTSIASTVLTNATSGSSLTSGLALAGITGGLAERSVGAPGWRGLPRRVSRL